MSITHGDCKEHVSLFRGCTYCNRANMVYIQTGVVLGSEHTRLFASDVNAFVASVYRFQEQWKLRPLAFVLLDPSVTMPGLEGDGLNPDVTPPFAKEPKKERPSK